MFNIIITTTKTTTTQTTPTAAAKRHRFGARRQGELVGAERREESVHPLGLALHCR